LAAADSQPPELIVMQLVIIFGSIALHEFGHAKSADAAGDPTPRAQGRVTLNPFAHLDPVGAIMVVVTTMSGFGIGWGKPVMVNPRLMRNPRWDQFMSVLWGPLTNLLLAIFFAILLRMAGSTNATFAVFCYLAVYINVSLAVFNLIPIGPLDGHWLLAALLPPPYGARFGLWSRRTGSLVLLAIILVDGLVFRRTGQPGILSRVIVPPVEGLVGILTGLR
jgi:Zn-dependent protease